MERISILVVGGAATGDELEDKHRQLCERLGAEMARQGHHLVICSPFADSADVAVLRGYAGARVMTRHPVAFYYPADDAVRRRVSELEADVCVPWDLHLEKKPQPTPSTKEYRRPAFLLCQVLALEDSRVVAALGGRDDGLASMFLLLAEQRRKIVVPVSYLGGAAEAYLSRRMFRYEALPDSDVLSDPERVEDVVTFAAARCAQPTPGAPSDSRFFLSYSRLQNRFADLAETIMWRARVDVVRDQHTVEPDDPWRDKILRDLETSHVFVALWSKDYACSPHCFWEMQTALNRHREGGLPIWIFRLDETRLTFPETREMTPFDCRAAEEGDVRAKLQDKLAGHVQRFLSGIG